MMYIHVITVQLETPNAESYHCALEARPWV